MIPPDYETLAQRYDAGQAQVLWRELPADLETPVSAYLKLAAKERYGFLLESVEGGDQLGRYSFIGYQPDLVWSHANGQTQEVFRGQSTRRSDATPLDSLRDLLSRSRIADIPTALSPMAAGLVGYLAYDAVRWVERIPDANPDPLDLPQAVFIRPSMMAIFDRVTDTITLVTPVWPEREQSASDALQAAEVRLGVAQDRLAQTIPASLQDRAAAPPATPSLESNLGSEAFQSKVREAKDYIAAGDIFQVVLSQRFVRPFTLPPFALYRSLRRINPSPFLYYLNLDGVAVVGSSPEILVRARDGRVTIRPIAGTRPRGADAAEDQALGKALLADPKERAEHLMLLDLGRNDVGRVSQIGSVEVTAQFNIEHYSHVMHLVSNVEGNLEPSADILDALMAGFPAGTVSGAPKIRAMEIIDALESERRGIYAGGIGYFSADGQMDSCIALRTGIVKDGQLYIQAGAGIVADSDPQTEHQECLDKARALLRAAEDAEALAQSRDKNLA